MATECPDCGNSFSGYKCGCGYKLPFQRKDVLALSGASQNCTAHGCPMIGSISENTRPPHQWFCRFHWQQPADKWQEITHTLRQSPKEPTDEEKHMAEVKAYLKAHNLDSHDAKRYHVSKLVHDMANRMSAEPNKDWARNLIQRHEDGEFIPDRSLELAQKALR